MWLSIVITCGLLEATPACMTSIMAWPMKPLCELAVEKIGTEHFAQAEGEENFSRGETDARCIFVPTEPEA